MQPKAARIVELVSQEVKERECEIQKGSNISEIQILVRMDRRTGEPGKVRVSCISESIVTKVQTGFVIDRRRNFK